MATNVLTYPHSHTAGFPAHLFRRHGIYSQLLSRNIWHSSRSLQRQDVFSHANHDAVPLDTELSSTPVTIGSDDATHVLHNTEVSRILLSISEAVLSKVNQSHHFAANENDIDLPLHTDVFETKLDELHHSDLYDTAIDTSVDPSVGSGSFISSTVATTASVEEHLLSSSGEVVLRSHARVDHHSMASSSHVLLTTSRAENVLLFVGECALEL